MLPLYLQHETRGQGLELLDAESLTPRHSSRYTNLVKPSCQGKLASWEDAYIFEKCQACENR